MSQESLEDVLDAQVLTTIRCGRWFAEEWRARGLRPAGSTGRLMPIALSRFENGQVFDIADQSVIDDMGQIIRRTLNGMRDGYGDLAMCVDTNGHILFDDNLHKIRQLMEMWKSFTIALQNLRDTQAAIRARDSLRGYLR